MCDDFKAVCVFEIYYPRVLCRKKGDYVCVTVRQPSASSLPASPPTLLMLESPNSYA